MTQALRIVFAGTPSFAAAHLDHLISKSPHDVIAVYTQPDRPAGRGKKLRPSPVKELAQLHNIQVYQPLNFKSNEDLACLASLDADIMVVVAYGLLLPKAVLNTFTYGCINVHGSLLPRWRGAAPIQRAIEAGDTRTGVTIMQMDENLDTGDMLSKAECEIENNDNAASIMLKLEQLGQQALNQVLNQISKQSVQREPQNDSDSSYAAKILKTETMLDWALEAPVLHRKIRAFNPFPICYTFIAGKRLKVWQASITNNRHTQAPYGTLQIENDEIFVVCKSSSLRLDVLQLEGAKAMPASALLKGRSETFRTGILLGE